LLASQVNEIHGDRKSAVVLEGVPSTITSWTYQKVNQWRDRYSTVSIKRALSSLQTTAVAIVAVHLPYS